VGITLVGSRGIPTAYGGGNGSFNAVDKRDGS
jgi:hypothetical protein